MHSNAPVTWRGPRWVLSVLLALLGMLGPFAIDTYLPAFSAIARGLDATPLEMQQTLSAYLFAFAFMALFHGSLSDSFGRRPIVLWSLSIFTLASAGCALAPSSGWLIFFRAVQGLSAGGGIVVSRAVIRDLFAPAQAQRVMSQVTIFFGIAPAIAPMMGGWLSEHLPWQSVFWFLTIVAVLLLATIWQALPESLPPQRRQPLRLVPLLQGYWELIANPRFILLALASGVPFNGMFLYILAAPAFLGEHLHLQPGQFFWFFLLNIGGIMGGAWISGRMAGRVLPKHQIRHGFVIMVAMELINLAANLLFTPHVAWALLPICIFSFGWALMVPVITLLVLDLVPSRRGMASSLQMFVGSTANGFVAGVIAPLVMHSTVWLAVASLLLMLVGLLAWIYLHRRWPEIGRHFV
ncbi:MAG: Bcr/CflA family drug resistance efflux transporter [Comamonas sp. SCN 67-35]|uniref:multidrug effflux MFS transporter n=1 Tax=unclassified Comamonas TaxID=2638500 RepID=UPI00086D6A4E|nr:MULTISPECIES: multidrug effflux MFS transporter [unclassified Comamonas]MBN9330831.1 multidrug effflux MFS transporter [Comamonas sp.]ODU38283.1 MAG: Bcr/CflA family drug resistance efflux transporter [Comamonas sp. SCN 67-35]OJX03104.1 MAG: Bcr/CflA family drug resistance efflux transporter [Burkholderiales bacterium 66-26]